MVKRLLLAVMAVLLSLPVVAQKKYLDYDVDFEYYFDNREFDYGAVKYTESMTIHAACLTPWLGLRMPQNRNLTHSVRIGVDFMKNMGEQLPADKSIKELLFNYKVDYRMRRGLFSGCMGVFPRAAAEGEYPTAMFSDSLRFFDKNLEGAIFKWRSRSLYSEIVCDWMGMFGQNRRERFQIFSSGSWHIVAGLSVGWAASMYHYAGSEGQPGVVDNHILYPYLNYDLSHRTTLNEISLRLGFFAAYQRDRLEGKSYYPFGTELELRLRWRSLGLFNSFYVGDDLMPMYNVSRYGEKYGAELYFGSPFYRGGRGYDRMELYYAPRISSWLSLRLSTVFHFTDESHPFSGWQQRISLVFDLDSLRHPEFKQIYDTDKKRSYKRKQYSL